MNPKYFLLVLLTIIFSASGRVVIVCYAQQDERTSETQLTRDHSLFPLQSTGIWVEVHPLIPRVIYFGVHFANANLGWAVGEGGAIIKTTNGGQKWNWIESGVENTLKTVYSINSGQRVIVAGDGGIILFSEDEGENWSSLPSGTANIIWNMQMITNEIGWMVGEGAAALKTTDGGLTWILQQMPHTNLPYWDVSFSDLNYGYIAGNNAVILKTTNGGTDWQVQIAGDNRSLFTVYAFDSLKVVAGGFAGKVVITTDGGNSWTQLPNIQSNVNRIKFIDSLNGFAVTTGSNFQSTDGGYSWIYRPDLHNPIGNWNIDFPDLLNGYIAGARMQLMKTSNSGVNWDRTVNNFDLIGVYFSSETEGLIIGNDLGTATGDKLYKTTDGGATLNVVESFPNDSVWSVADLIFTNNETGYIGTAPTRIYKTIDGGESWYKNNIVGLSDTIGVIKKLFFYGPTIGWAIKGNQIMKTTNSGENWIVQQNIPGTLSSILFIDTLVGWATNASRMPYKTTNGGISWVEQINSNIQLSRDVFFKNYQEGYIVRSNIFYQTTDGGISWLQDSSFSGFGFARFINYNTNNIFLTGNKVYRTTNGGNNWEEFPELQEQGLVTGYLWVINSGYFIGNTGLIIKYFDETVPVELINFNGSLGENETLLRWTTATEINNKGFYVQRKRFGELVWSEISFIEGKGNSTELNSYFYKDILSEAGIYFYRLKQIDFNGEYEYSKEIEINFLTPSEIRIMSNFPNPFNSSTNVRVILPEESVITIKLFNALGELVKTIVSKELQAGIFDIEMNLSELSSGVYIYNVIAKTKTGNIYSKSNKMTLTK